MQVEELTPYNPTTFLTNRPATTRSNQDATTRWWRLNKYAGRIRRTYIATSNNGGNVPSHVYNDDSGKSHESSTHDMAHLSISIYRNNKWLEKRFTNTSKIILWPPHKGCTSLVGPLWPHSRLSWLEWWNKGIGIVNIIRACSRHVVHTTTGRDQECLALFAGATHTTFH